MDPSGGCISKKSDATKAANRRKKKEKQKAAEAIASVSVVSPTVQSALAISKKRTANGQYNRTSRVRREETPKQIKQTVLDQRAKLVGAAKAESRDAESALGVLKLNGLVTRNEYLAGKWFLNTTHDGQRVNGDPPRTPRSANTSGAKGPASGDVVPTLADIRAKLRYEGALKVLLKMGWHIYSEVDSVCIDDRPPTDIAALKAGLSALSQSFCRSAPDMDIAC